MLQYAYLVFTFRNSTGFNFKIGGSDTSSCDTNPQSSTKKRATSLLVDASNIDLKPNKFYRYYIVSTTPNGTSSYISQISDISEIVQTSKKILFLSTWNHINLFCFFSRLLRMGCWDYRSHFIHCHLRSTVHIQKKVNINGTRGWDQCFL